MKNFTQEELCILANKCPKCETQLVYKIGYNKNSDFLRCPKYPDCEYTYPADATIALLRLEICRLKVNLEKK